MAWRGRSIMAWSHISSAVDFQKLLIGSHTFLASCKPRSHGITCWSLTFIRNLPASCSGRFLNQNPFANIIDFSHGSVSRTFCSVTYHEAMPLMASTPPFGTKTAGSAIGSGAHEMLVRRLEPVISGQNVSEYRLEVFCPSSLGLRKTLAHCTAKDKLSGSWTN